MTEERTPVGPAADEVPLSKRWQCVWDDEEGNEHRSPPLGFPARVFAEGCARAFTSIHPDRPTRVELWAPTEAQREHMCEFFEPFRQYLEDMGNEEREEAFRQSDCGKAFVEVLRKQRERRERKTGE